VRAAWSVVPALGPLVAELLFALETPVLDALAQPTLRIDLVPVGGRLVRAHPGAVEVGRDRIEFRLRLGDRRLQRGFEITRRAGDLGLQLAQLVELHLARSEERRVGKDARSR